QGEQTQTRDQDPSAEQEVGEGAREEGKSAVFEVPMTAERDQEQQSVTGSGSPAGEHNERLEERTESGTELRQPPDIFQDFPGMEQNNTREASVHGGDAAPGVVAGSSGSSVMADAAASGATNGKEEEQTSQGSNGENEEQDVKIFPASANGAGLVPGVPHEREVGDIKVAENKEVPNYNLLHPAESRVELEPAAEAGNGEGNRAGGNAGWDWEKENGEEMKAEGGQEVDNNNEGEQSTGEAEAATASVQSQPQERASNADAEQEGGNAGAPVEGGWKWEVEEEEGRTGAEEEINAPADGAEASDEAGREKKEVEAAAAGDQTQLQEGTVDVGGEPAGGSAIATQVEDGGWDWKGEDGEGEEGAEEEKYAPVDGGKAAGE
ncbi:unnamed protein product, partial [Sphacelaria rigidula]